MDPVSEILRYLEGSFSVDWTSHLKDSRSSCVLLVEHR